MGFWRHKSISRYHRWSGLFLSIPLLAWIISSQMLHYIGMTAPNGLQGIYQLQPYNSLDVSLSDAEMSPSGLLAHLRREEGLDRIFWLRLQAFGDRLLYLVKPTPFSLGQTYDAMTGERLDPLTDELLLKIANEKLLGTRATVIEPADQEFNRDYQLASVPAVAVRMEGEQPSTIILSRSTGRTLRRIDSDAASFNWWYRQLHVIQWGPNIWLFTVLLFGIAFLVLLQTASGGRLWWIRRGRKRGRSRKQKAFQTHRVFGVTILFFLVAQMFVGAYMWLNLGPFQGGFRGKGTFNASWVAGLPTETLLPTAADILTATAHHLEPARQPQWIEWRMRSSEPVVLLSSRRDDVGEAFSINGGKLPVLTPQQAGEMAGQQLVGQPGFRFEGEAAYYWNDLNRRIPVYKFRFDDPRSTDIFVGTTSGEVVARRTDYWRLFGPFLRFHAFGWTRNWVIDTLLLIVFQLGLVGLLFSGWRLHFVSPPPPRTEGN